MITNQNQTKQYCNYKQLLFQQDIESSMVEQHVNSIFQGMNYLMNHLEQYINVNLYDRLSDHLVSRLGIELPIKDQTNYKKTLLLDLDETLIHSHVIDSDHSGSGDYDIILNYEFRRLGVITRPYLKYFLQKVRLFYEIYIFTASKQMYADLIVQFIDPEYELIDGIIDRDYCLKTNHGFYIKDIRMIKNRRIEDILLVDNNVHSFGSTIDNGVPVLDFKGDKNDQELKYLTYYLIAAYQSDNLIEFNQSNLQLKVFFNQNLN